MSWGTEHEETRLCWMNEVLTWTFVSNNHRPLVSNSDVLCLSVGESIHSEALHRGWWANARCKYAGTNGRSGRHIRGLTGCFLSQGMGMVVHQALTEYNRWDPVLAARQKRAFNDAANGARRLLVSSLWSDDTHECSISVLLGEKSRHFNACSYLYLTLFFSRWLCDFFCFVLGWDKVWKLECSLWRRSCQSVCTDGPIRVMDDCSICCFVFCG